MGASTYKNVKALIEAGKIDEAVNLLSRRSPVDEFPFGFMGMLIDLGSLGVINGLFGIRSDGYRYITMDVNEKTGRVNKCYRTDSYHSKEYLWNKRL